MTTRLQKRRRIERELMENPEMREAFHEVLQQIAEDPHQIAMDLLQARKNVDEAAESVENMKRMIDEMVDGNAAMYHIETVRLNRLGHPRAVCRSGNQLREIGVHPEVSVEALEKLESWEYVMVHEDVVVDLWHDDPALFANAKGEVVEFKGYADRETHQVRVRGSSRDERVVMLRGDLPLEELTVGQQLILQQDDARYAIATLPPESQASQFEVSLDQVQASLEDLAGIEDVAEQFIEDVLLRMVMPDIRDEFALQPLQGALLYSYKPGMGKTAFMRAFAAWLRDFGADADFDVALFQVKPNQLKSMWWGEDARIVREELWGSIKAKQRLPRTRPLVILVVFDEVDSIQKRGGGNQQMSAASHSDALEALLVEMDGMVNADLPAGPPAHVLCVGLTNRPDRLDEALKREGRFGDLVAQMPDLNREAAEDILAIYSEHPSLPWEIDGEVRCNVPVETIREQFLRPVVHRLFDMTVAHYATDSQREVPVTVGELMVGVHYQGTMNRAKRSAAKRKMQEAGIPAVTFDDVLEGMLDCALDVARQMEADPAMLVQQLRVQVAVSSVTAVSRESLEQHRFLKVHSAG